MREEGKGEGKGKRKGKGEERAQVVKLFTEKDDSVENRTAYEVFALTTLGIDRANGAWFFDGDEYAMFLHTEAREPTQKHIEQGDYVDFSPNEERLAYFGAYLSLWREREERIKRIEKIIEELKAVG